MRGVSLERKVGEPKQEVKVDCAWLCISALFLVHWNTLRAVRGHYCLFLFYNPLQYGWGSFLFGVFLSVACFVVFGVLLRAVNRDT